MKEIIAKKLRHRGDKQTARDLFDFALVAEKEPNELAAAARFVVRHIDTMLSSLRCMPTGSSFGSKRSMPCITGPATGMPWRC